MKTIKKAIDKWMRFWMRMAGRHTLGRISAGFAAWGQPPFYGRIPLSRYRSKSYISIWATLHHRDLKIGRNVFIDQNVLIYQDSNGSSIEIDSEVHLHRDTVLQTGSG
ncbi:MAG: acyltransferase, partial [Candidatus Zixiibacteriota bacterium]